jgi:hypothetical protein
MNAQMYFFFPISNGKLKRGGGGVLEIKLSNVHHTQFLSTETALIV